MKEKKCKRCGKSYWGTASSKYCMACRDLARFEKIQAWHERKND